MNHERTVAAYATWMGSWGASPRTIEARSTFARSRLREWSLTGFTAENIQEFLARDTADWTRLTYYNHLNDLVAWLRATGAITGDPMRMIRRPRQPEAEPWPLEPDEQKLVLSVARGPVLTMIMLGLYAGLRAHETAKFHGADITKERIRVVGKGRKASILPCMPELWEVAQTMPRDRYWFPGATEGQPMKPDTVSMHVGKLFRGLGIDGGYHRCRHTFATNLVRNGVHARAVQALMRHSQLNTISIYTKMSDYQLREAIETLRPGA
ncbi:hypothetical protein GCM10022215_29450 [Nocardioides fonticola]|uniref:Tyr recombinase domain-containing protein n=1 Tax=Nocardioides fonticola TaxID=450363 RepID=A0ABP7XP40_9ACTN